MMRTMIVMGALSLGVGGGCVAKCPHLVSPAGYYQSKSGRESIEKTLECGNYKACLAKAKEAARGQDDVAARAHSCHHSRRAARAERRIARWDERAPPRRLIDRAARHRDAEAEALRRAVGETEPFCVEQHEGSNELVAGTDVSNPPNTPEPKTRFVLLTRHAEAQNDDEDSSCSKSSCDLTEDGKAMAQDLATVLDGLVNPGCFGAFEGLTQTEQTAEAVAKIDKSIVVKVDAGNIEKPWTMGALEKCKVLLVVGQSAHMRTWLEVLHKEMARTLGSIIQEHGIMLVLEVDEQDNAKQASTPVCYYGQVEEDVESLRVMCDATLPTLLPAASDDGG